MSISFQRTMSVARKEVLHVLRDPATLMFALFLPVLELFMLGYAIDTNVRHIRTAVFDQAQTQESRELLRAFVNSEDFRIVEEVTSPAALHQAIVAGRVKVGIQFPEDFSRKLEAGETAQVLILVDGSESSTAGEAVNVSNAIALRESLARSLGDRALPIEARPRILFNPDTRSANFFLPGLIVIMCQMMATLLTANAIVREKEFGTLEQLFMTPVEPAEVILGKLVPYLVLTFAELMGIAVLMVVVFGVPVHGSFVTFLLIALPFVVSMLGLGLAISTKAATRDAAMHMVTATIMPSVFLSGYIFPLTSMPVFFQYVALAFPTTWLIDAARGVILRGAGWDDLWLNAVVLWGMAALMLGYSVMQFRKRTV